MSSSNHQMKSLLFYCGFLLSLQPVSAQEFAAQVTTGLEQSSDSNVETEIVHGIYNILPNLTLAKLMSQNLQSLGGIEYSAEEQRCAEQISKTYTKKSRVGLGSEKTIVPFSEKIVETRGSTDVGDVSWVAPTVGVMTATCVPGTAAYTWQSTAASGTSIGHKGMMLAARSMALTSISLFENPKIVQQAKEEWLSRRGNDFDYQPLLGDRLPPLEYRN